MGDINKLKNNYSPNVTSREIFGDITNSVRISYHPKDNMMVAEFYKKPTAEQINAIKKNITKDTYLELELFDAKNGKLIKSTSTDINPIGEFNKFVSGG